MNTLSQNFVENIVKYLPPDIAYIVIIEYSPTDKQMCGVFTNKLLAESCVEQAKLRLPLGDCNIIECKVNNIDLEHCYEL